MFLCRLAAIVRSLVCQFHRIAATSSSKNNHGDDDDDDRFRRSM